MTKTARTPLAQGKTKTTAKKTVTKKTVAKKTAVKKTTAKKAQPKASAKASAAKPAAKKTTVQKTTAKKIVSKPTAKTAAKTKTASNLPPAIKAMAKAVEKALDMNKAKDVIAVDLSRKSSLADFMIVASGNSSRQVAALARYAEEAMLKNGAKRCRIEGLPQGDWVIVDSGDVVVHLFRPEVREFYQLERLWTDEGEANSRRNLA